MITDSDLRINYDFVSRFEALRKRHGVREMTDAALREISDTYGVPYESVRLWRHLRNALAHGDRVNAATVAEELKRLLHLTDVGSEFPAAKAVPNASDGARAAQRRAFRVHAWTDDRLEQEMLANGFIAIGGDEIGDLAQVQDRETIRSILTQSMPEKSTRAIALFVGYWTRFLWAAENGDLIALPLRDRTVALGEFSGPYHYVTGKDSRARHRRSVAWTVRVQRDTLTPEVTKVLNSQHTVQEFPPDAAETISMCFADHTTATSGTVR